ncbi:ABC transporter permease [Natrarchaeobius chitinivorans]|uniref:ABC transporter permease n=1 Tax=Natrarchaeobius chitinivorans TaxID=1679083 RepID=A0A3N6LV32_NATCH|nr:ABC transporter permease [Natrarchaeobius chitinivorans]RQG94193.1 ABC transporter permease [Natrarchaeobius chitinivorans]
MGWITYSVRRLLISVFVLFVASILIFSIVRLIPGDPARVFLGPTADQEAVDTLRVQLDLHLPIYEQYLNWIAGVLTGNWGNSLINDIPVFDLVLIRFPRSIQLAIFSLIIGVIISLPLGLLAALQPNSGRDYAALFFSQFGMSVPSFWLGIILMLVFGRYLGVLPASGYVSPMEDPVAAVSHMIMPAFALGTINAAVLTRFLRSEILEQRGKEYVLTARAFGHYKGTILRKYVLKNALIPYMTNLGIQFGWVLGGVVIIEVVFSYPGLGRLVLDGLLNRDYPVIQMGLLVLISTYVLVNLVVDLTYSVLNPKIRY